MVLQVVIASIKPEQRERWLEVIPRNAVETRAEEGCHSYQIAEDLEAPNTFVIIERWESIEAVYDHFRNQFERLMEALGDVFVVPPVAFVYELGSTFTLEDVLKASGVSR
jgi:quinol monooxygenase YgiN